MKRKGPIQSAPTEKDKTPLDPYNSQVNCCRCQEVGHKSNVCL